MAAETIVLIGISEATSALLEGARTKMQSRCQEFPTVEEYLGSGDTESAACLVIECDLEEWAGSRFQQAVHRSSSCPIVLIAKARASEPATQTGVMTVLSQPTTETLFRAIDQTQQLHRKRNDDSELEQMKSRLSKLTDSEWAVLTLILQGESNRSIANQLERSLRTIEARRRRIFEKTGAASLPELIVLATRVQYEHATGNCNSPATGSRIDGQMAEGR